MVLVDVVRLLQSDLLRPRPCVSSDQQLQVPNRVGRVALDPHLATETIVADHLHHLVLACLWRGDLQLDGLPRSFSFVLGELGLVLCFLCCSSLLDLLLVSLSWTAFVLARIVAVFTVPSLSLMLLHVAVLLSLIVAMGVVAVLVMLVFLFLLLLLVLLVFLVRFVLFLLLIFLILLMTFALVAFVLSL